MACAFAEQDQTDRSHEDSPTSLTLFSLAVPIVMAVGVWKSEKMMRRYEAVAVARARATRRHRGNRGWQPPRKSPP
jgi:hypothetical protein